MWKGIILSVAILSVCSGVATAQISGTSHDFSLDSGETRVCVFCHTPHNANPATPLWNHKLSSEVYALYPGPASDPKSSLERDPIQPEIGSSTKLCLSCHDGTIGIGDYFGSQESIGYVSGDALIADTLNRDLSNDHPVSIELAPRTLDKDTELINPADNPSSRTKLEANNVECGSCHDPHDNTIGNFLVTTTDNGDLCLECHDQEGWVDSAHATAQDYQEWTPYLTGEPIKKVSEWACLGCHKPHGAVQGTRLLRPYYKSAGLGVEDDPETGACLNCHDGASVDGVPNIKGEFDKATQHPVHEYYSGEHFPKEVLPDKAALIVTHVECADCHDPHQGQHSERRIGDDSATGMLHGVVAPEMNPDRYGAAWTSPNVTPMEEVSVSHEYELCLKCHSSYSKMDFGEEKRHMQEIDIYFNPNNSASHGCIAPNNNRNPYVIKGLTEKLKQAWLDNGVSTDIGVVACSDCHGSDSGEIDGPHGSNQPWLLRDVLTEEGDFAGNTVVCYRCHDPAVYGKGGNSQGVTDSSRTAFAEHTKSGHWWNQSTYPSSVPEIGCLVCHGEFPETVVPNQITPGGLHGANFPRQDRQSESPGTYTTSPIHFLNGLGIKIEPEDTTKLLDGGEEINCSGFVRSDGIGCNAHWGTGNRPVDVKVKYTRPSDAIPIME